MKLTLLLTLVLLITIVACTTLPRHIVVSPEVIGYSKNIYFDKSIQLNIIDQRSANYVVQIIKDGEPAKLLSSQDSLSNIISNALIPVFRKQGLALNQYATTNLNIMIDSALINVQQSMMNYTASNTIALSVSLTNTNKVISKSFTVSGNSSGPLVADIAVLERDFNHQLAGLLAKISNDIEIQNAVKEK